ncbi:hypothetical protein RvY_14998 [Ramazzottius varieornatus]|uniref:Rho guanine nucleotide exchange factor 12 n=1 Tax=Ramazzottius varieornatus TaxID=947166 RepID=A0A1D1VT98_RAMVA|nr:hypothetical protein RvY_14998 [Ramazzottius varieornatus]
MATVSSMDVPKRPSGEREKKKGSSNHHKFPSPTVTVTGAATASRVDHLTSSSAEKRYVVFRRDEQGYGLKVYGDNPVFVDTVKENGPADSVGLRPGDRIIKVNNQLVTDKNHFEVVELIKSQPCVAMTVVRTAHSLVPENARPSGNGERMYENNGMENPVRRKVSLPAVNLSDRFSAEDERIAELTESKSRSDSLPSSRSYPEALENVLYQRGDGNRGDSTTLREMPPTPPPIERIPRFHEASDMATRSMRAAASAGLNRRRSNPEAMHLGVARMTLTSNNQAPLLEQPPTSSSSLNRSSSAVSVHRKNSIPDSQPPALPVKKRSDQSARYRNASLHDVTEVGAPSSGTPPPPYPEPATFRPINHNAVTKSGSLSALAGATVGSVRLQNLSGDVLQPGSSVLQQLDSYGPFSNFYFLINKHLPHLAVFINFLLQEKSLDIAPVLFHVLTDHYTKGNFKEMQRWAVELHSTFLVPDSPLDIFGSSVQCGSSNSLIHAIDVVLAKPEREEALRDVFTKVRAFALDAAQLRLKELRDKLKANLGGLYGPSEAELAKAVNSADQSREVAETLLAPHLEALTDMKAPEEPENRCDREAALACALATFLKFNGIKAVSRADGTYLVDKWPLLLQKDKSKFKLKDRKKNITVSGHQFAAVALSTTILHCTQCGDVMWGVAPQGYQCIACEYTAHRACVKNIEEACVGDKKELRRSFISMDSFGLFGRKRSNNSPTAISNARKSHDEKEEDDKADHLGSTEQLEGSHAPVGSYVNKVVHQFESGKVGEMGPPPDPATTSAQQSKAPPLTVVGRSESLKSTHNRKSNLAKGAGVRKKSDPAHFHRSGESNDNGETSSGDLGIGMSSSSLSQSTSHSGSLHFTMDIADDDSDFEADPEHIPSWQASVEPATVQGLTSQQKKRQEVLAELFHTEQTHVRNLKVLCKVFYQPMLKEKLLPDELIAQIFANLEEMTTLHSELNRQMKVLKRSQGLIGSVGDILLNRFAGDNGSTFRTAAAAFCHNQTASLEALKNSQHKNGRLVQFLHEAAANPLCRRLQLKDIIPTGMQRLTKYPLLLESLLKYTPNETDEEKIEYQRLQDALTACRTTLDYVNQAISETNNKNRLRELQDRIDMTSFIKSQHKLALDHRSLDLSQYRLLHDGDLTWRLSKTKTVDLHVILLNKILLLVTKQDDKLLLKFHTPPVAGINENKRSESFTSRSWAPVLTLDGLSVRDVATDPKAFFLFLSTDNGAQMYELVANSTTEKNLWKRYILAAVSRNTNCYESIPEVIPVTATPSTVGSVLAVPGQLAPPLDLAVGGGKPGAVDPLSFTQSGALDPQVMLQGGALDPLSGLRPQHPWTEREPSDVEDDEDDEEEEVQLLTPADIIVTEATCVMDDAHLIFSPMQELKRRDDMLEEALEQKSRLVSRILGFPVDSPSSNLDDEDEEVEAVQQSRRSVKSVMHHLMQNIAQLTRLVKDSLTVSQEEELIVQRQRLDSFSVTTTIDQVDHAPSTSSSTVDSAVQTHSQRPLIAAEDLQPVVGHLHRQLTTLLRMVAEQEHEKDRLSWQLRVTKDELDSLRAETRASSNEDTTTRPTSSGSTLEEEMTQEEQVEVVSQPTPVPLDGDEVVVSVKADAPKEPEGKEEVAENVVGNVSPLEQVQHL